MKEIPQRQTGIFLNALRSMVLRGALKSMRRTADREHCSVDDSRSFFTWIIAVSGKVDWKRCPGPSRQVRHGLSISHVQQQVFVIISDHFSRSQPHLEVM